VVSPVPHSRPHRLLAYRRLLLCLAALAAAACGRIEPPEQAGELVVALRADPVFYQQEAQDSNASGFEQDLIQAFAAELGVKARIVVARDAEHLTEMLRRGEVHFAAGAPATGPDTGFRFTAPLLSARLLVAQHTDDLPHENLDDLATHPIELLPGSAAEVALRRLGKPMNLVEVPAAANDIDLLARVSNGLADLVATDSAHFEMASTFYPDLTVAVELPDSVDYAWAFHAEDEALRQKADAFIAGARQDGTLARIHDRYFGHIKRLNNYGIARFLEHMQTLLPHYRPEFQQAQELTGLDWRLIAALAYQESKWDPLATSPTGVRGMMMLTEDTADRMKVSNRLDPRQSIRAGARYLQDLIEQLPPEATDPDRQWLALAAYNLGMGHLNGARQFAVGMKRDPNSWYDMKRVLPLLARPEYYNRLKSGKARGGEAVILVENVRTYFGILARFEPPYAGLSLSRPPR